MQEGLKASSDRLVTLLAFRSLGRTTLDGEARRAWVNSQHPDENRIHVEVQTAKTYSHSSNLVLIDVPFIPNILLATFLYRLLLLDYTGVGDWSLAVVDALTNGYCR